MIWSGIQKLYTSSSRRDSQSGVLRIRTRDKSAVFELGKGFVDIWDHLGILVFVSVVEMQLLASSSISGIRRGGRGGWVTHPWKVWGNFGRREGRRKGKREARKEGKWRGKEKGNCKGRMERGKV